MDAAETKGDTVTGISRAGFWLSPQEWETLRICEGLRAVRSNYTADHPELYGWRVHWASLDVLVHKGLIMKIGRYYQPTEAGWQRLHPAEPWEGSLRGVGERAAPPTPDPAQVESDVYLDTA